VVWQVVSYTSIVSQIYLASPARTGNALMFGFVEGDLLDQTQATILRMIDGWLLSSLVGNIIGSIVGISASARGVLVANARIPPSAARIRRHPGGYRVIWADAHDGDGRRDIRLALANDAGDRPWLREHRSRTRRSRPSAGPLPAPVRQKMGLPNATPDILAGMRLSLTVALILTIVGEMITGQDGLSSAILVAGRSPARPPRLHRPHIERTLAESRTALSPLAVLAPQREPKILTKRLIRASSAFSPPEAVPPIPKHGQA
jgi:sulfonate transport system permease protein